DDDIEFSTSPDGATWAPPEPVDPTDATMANGFANAPEIATDGNGKWVVVWVNDNKDILASRFPNASNNLMWSAPVPLNPNFPASTQSRFPHVATDGKLWVTVWSGTGCDGTDRDVCYATSPNGLDWTPRGALNSNSAGNTIDDCDPRVAR